MDSIRWLLIAIPALPLAAAVVTATLGPRVLRRYSHWPAVIALATASVLSLVLVARVQRAQADQRSTGAAANFEHIVTVWTWAAVDNAYVLPPAPPGESASSMLGGGQRDFRFDIVLRADGLTAMMLAMVTCVALLVVVFSTGYMQGDRGYWRFFAYVSLFVFSMIMLVTVSSFLLLYVFWEAVGVCSYLLIGFWYEKPEAAAAGTKAFLVNRVGDFGFAIALFLIWINYGTLNFHDSLRDGRIGQAEIQQVVGQANPTPVANSADSLVPGVLGQRRIEANDYVGGKTGLAICLLLMLGACGKSAQFPLHVWLPDAMEGPTPVSALIHAATMVTAGVYMVARCTPLFMVSAEAQLVVASIGAFTALMAGLIALTQFDLKRVLAYSTVSQLGFMFLALGTGTFAGITAGMFHLFTHAFFKAVLFLGAGSVMHAMGNIIDVRRFGGLRRIMPTTHGTFLIGCVALAGVPPFAGFWSKDGILAAVEERAHPSGHATVSGSHADEPGMVAAAEPTAGDIGARAASAEQRGRFGPIYQALYYVALFTALLTTLYTFRAFYLTFYGKLRVPHEAGDHAHESPPAMTIPLIVLAIGAGIAGFAFDRTYTATPGHLFSDFIGGAPSLAAGLVSATRRPYEFHLTVAGVSTLIALGGWLVATYLYVGELRETAWLKSVLDFERPAKWLDVESVSQLRKLPWVAATHRFAERIGVGRISTAVGQVLLVIALILATPFLLGHYLSPYKLSRAKFYFDEIYLLIVVLPLRLLAELCYAVDRWIVDGAVNLVGRIPPAMGTIMRSLQMGLVPFYALAMLLGMLVLFAAQLLWAG